jgi:hypothetical protein
LRRLLKLELNTPCGHRNSDVRKHVRVMPTASED